MKTYKDPSFQDRVGRAADAKKKALEQLRSRPPRDAAVAAERKAASVKRERTVADKDAARRAAKKAVADAATAEAEAKAAIPPPPTEAERKAGRDARYAARKNRK
jgi:membrane protein involved in colicin uptake